MAEILIPVDGELAVIAELSATLPAHGHPNLTEPQGTVGTKIPTTSTKPREFVRVTTTGGARRDLVTDSHTLVVEAYATREGDARDLCALAVGLLEAAGRAGALGGRTCYRVSASVPVNLPHPSVPTHFRYRSTISADLRRSAV
ncbi:MULTISPECIES: hypothetical protein [unclassified Microbacterium]|uniref:hypothetical protein n=1 Tax=Microbacterium TaxID=33882 RepID=UPI003BA00A2B